MGTFMWGKRTAKLSLEVAGSELDHRVAFYPTQQLQHRKSHFKASAGGSCGGVGGVLGHPLNCLSTGTASFPPVLCSR